jgi:hypothetical protein
MVAQIKSVGRLYVGSKWRQVVLVRLKVTIVCLAVLVCLAVFFKLLTNIRPAGSRAV